MKSIIYYFSGTGNSLKIAKDLKKNIEDTEIIPIIKALNEKDFSCEAERVGFVFPIYCANIPPIVKEFVGKINLDKAKYIFTVANCGGIDGNTLFNMNSILKDKNYKLNSAFTITMPDNSIIYKNSEEDRKKFLDKENKSTKEIASIILENKNVGIKGKYKSYMNGLSKVMAWAMKSIYRVDRKGCVEEKCIKCGICDMVCPTNNITLSDNFPKWGKNCTQCFACIHWCPKSAVKFGRVQIKNNNNYHNPDVVIQDIISQKM
ncbi:EFR1 family ferrodoxin [Clostridium sp. MSJ-4]|uniref:EFR1 family ferrodoxin n=1 Tax=Clostridium simiarum TaxID=2841506 RepID=A0ABS6EYR3_9CLOT|nr:EFR1 family ferrodoxin [Clostridium simiarum]MBU5590885.1 EFR1 family ferrodoxin [Clostridium simiarum]